MSQGASSVTIVEVGPRDGLQNEQRAVSTEAKISLIERSIAAGIRRIEVASFVHPGKVPQMADAEAVVAGLPDRDDVSYIGLVLNKRGALRALETKVDELGMVCVSTDSFSQANQGMDCQQSMREAIEIARLADGFGRKVQVTLAAAFGCPFEGEVDPGHVRSMAMQLADSGMVSEIALADTIGVGVPGQVTDLVGAICEAIAPLPLRAHFHNTRNTGLANVWAAVSGGVGVIDASLGGMGGCPFAPKATGNVPTEDVVYMLERSGISTGVDLDALINSSAWLSTEMGKRLPAMLPQAGNFPKSTKKEGLPS